MTNQDLLIMYGIIIGFPIIILIIVFILKLISKVLNW